MLLMTIEELKSKGADEYITEGPNSGGVSGYYYLDGIVYSFWDDFGSGGISGTEDVKSFVKRNLNNENSRVKDVAVSLQRIWGINI